MEGSDEQMINLKKDHKDIKVENRYHTFLTEQKIKVMGVNRSDQGVFVDIRGWKYKIVKLEFLQQNGSSEEITVSNRMKLNQVISQLMGKCKFTWLKESKNSLDKNIQYYMELAEKETNVAILESLIERLEIMRSANKWKQISFYAFVSYDNFDSIIELLSSVYAVDILDERKAEQVLCMLGNAMVRV